MRARSTHIVKILGPSLFIISKGLFLWGDVFKFTLLNCFSLSIETFGVGQGQGVLSARGTSVPVISMCLIIPIVSPCKDKCCSNEGRMLCVPRDSGRPSQSQAVTVVGTLLGSKEEPD